MSPKFCPQGTAQRGRRVGESVGQRERQRGRRSLSTRCAVHAVADHASHAPARPSHAAHAGHHLGHVHAACSAHATHSRLSRKRSDRSSHNRAQQRRQCSSDAQPRAGGGRRGWQGREEGRSISTWRRVRAVCVGGAAVLCCATDHSAAHAAESSEVVGYGLLLVLVPPQVPVDLDAALVLRLVLEQRVPPALAVLGLHQRHLHLAALHRPRALGGVDALGQLKVQRVHRGRRARARLEAEVRRLQLHGHVGGGGQLNGEEQALAVLSPTIRTAGRAGSVWLLAKAYVVHLLRG